jgi:hypothetical protein
MTGWIIIGISLVAAIAIVYLLKLLAKLGRPNP